MPKTAKDLISVTEFSDIDRVRRALETEKRRSAGLVRSIEEMYKLLDYKHVPTLPCKPRKNKAARHFTRVIIPDTHGTHLDTGARDSFLHDLSMLEPNEVVWLGDHIDCAGTFSGFARQNTHELAESFSEDVAAANDFIDRVHAASPNASHHYIQGNHEARIDKWAARSFINIADARLAIEALGYVGVLHLKRRGFRWYDQDTFYGGLAIPGTMRLGKVHFTHGFSFAKQAATVTLDRVSDNIVFGHTHRIQSVVERTVAREAFGAWSVGCLSKLQPLYRHTTPTSWSHGYGVQFVNTTTGTFAHFTVPLIKNDSLLLNVIDGLHQRKHRT